MVGRMISYDSQVINPLNKNQTPKVSLYQQLIIHGIVNSVFIHLKFRLSILFYPNYSFQ